MKRIVYLLMMLILASQVVALQIKTNITLDYIGNNEFFIRTEVGDKKFNMSNQTDYKWTITFNRDCPNVTTNTDLLLKSITNITKNLKNTSDYCRNAVKQYNLSKVYADEKAAHERVIVYYEDCKTDKTYLTSLSTNKTKSLDECSVDLVSYKDDVRNYVNLYNNATNTINNQSKDASNNLIIGLVVGAGAIGFFWYYQEKQRKGPSATKERREMGFGSQY